MIEHNVKVNEDQTEWRLFGKRHREDVPALEHNVKVNEDQTEWRLFGKRHREDVPAVEHFAGRK